jgi:hypothetical protein
MTAGELIKLIPDETFRELAIETNVDSHVKKLSGEVIFKLILFSMLNSEKLSLRVMERYLQSAKFKNFSRYDILDGKYNSIRDRICTINADYFEGLFKKIFVIYNKELKEENALSKADSTFVGLAAKLFAGGMENGGVDHKRFVKYSVSLKGSLPSSIKVFTENSHASDEPSLAELISDDDHIDKSVVVFDRGLQSRVTFDKFSSENKFFITRSKQLYIACEVESNNDIPVKPADSTVTINSDQICYLKKHNRSKTKHLYRIIKGTMDANDQEIIFLSNILDEDAYTIAKWYKQRWEIEVFFKFIKQHLNVKHLVSRDNNGIKVMIYMTLILATLIIAYKKINKLKGFKIPKLQFEIELENEIIKTIVVLCGGDPDRARHLFSSA